MSRVLNSVRYKADSEHSLLVRHLLDVYKITILVDTTTSPIIEWCVEHGALQVDNVIDDITLTPPMTIDGRFVDFYDEETYALFKMVWE